LRVSQAKRVPRFPNDCCTYSWVLIPTEVFQPVPLLVLPNLAPASMKLSRVDPNVRSRPQQGRVIPLAEARSRHERLAPHHSKMVRRS
jgi:hypothetical protein